MVTFFSKKTSLKIAEIVSDMKMDTLNGFTNHLKKVSDMDYSTVIENAIDETDKRWSNSYDVISGRKFFNRLSQWTQDEFGITICAQQLIPFFEVNDVPEEVSYIIRKFVDK